MFRAVAKIGYQLFPGMKTISRSETKMVKIKKTSIEGGAVTEWSEAQLVRENKRKTKKMTGLPPGLGKKQPL